MVKQILNFYRGRSLITYNPFPSRGGSHTSTSVLVRVTGNAAILIKIGVAMRQSKKWISLANSFLTRNLRKRPSEMVIFEAIYLNVHLLNLNTLFNTSNYFHLNMVTTFGNSLMR